MGHCKGPAQDGKQKTGESGGVRILKKRKERTIKALSTLVFIWTQIERLVRVTLLVAERLGGTASKEGVASPRAEKSDNPYALALRDLLANGGLDTANRTNLRKLIPKTNDPEVHRLLKRCEVDPKVFRSGAFYVTEKCIRFAFALTREFLDVSEFNEVAFVAIKTILLCHEADERLLNSDIEAAILKDCKPAKGREKLIYEKRKRIDSPAQVQQAFAMGITLGYLRKESKGQYAIMSNAILKLASKRLSKVAMT